MAQKVKSWGSLLTEVIREGLCTSCGACDASCPVNALAIANEQPTLVGVCIACQVCYYQCPVIDFPTEDVERSIFGRTRREDEPIGIYRSAYVARSKREDILRLCQDGGAVTSILVYALDSQLIDCAVVTDIEQVRPWKPKPVVALTSNEIVKRAGTKYSPSPTLIGLASAAQEYGMGKVAIVGTPCQVRAVRKMQASQMGARKLGGAVELTIGLFCLESYNYNKLHAFLDQEGVNLTEITRHAIKKGRFMVYRRGELVFSVPVKEIKHLARLGCEECSDFTAEFADLSVGGVGIPEGWSLVVARSERAERLLSGAQESGLLDLKPVTEAKPGLSSAIRLALRKRERVAPKT